MRVLLDTSVLVAAMVESHPMHVAAYPWLKRAKDRQVSGIVAAHSVADLYAVLTTLPVQPRITPAVAHELVKHNVLDILDVIPLSAEDYEVVIDQISVLGISGGATYDALIVQAAANAGADQIVTLNEGDFRRVAPTLAVRVVSP